jgi:hypothetical protein
VERTSCKRFSLARKGGQWSIIERVSERVGVVCCKQLGAQFSWPQLLLYTCIQAQPSRHLLARQDSARVCKTAFCLSSIAYYLFSFSVFCFCFSSLFIYSCFSLCCFILFIPTFFFPSVVHSLFPLSFLSSLHSLIFLVCSVTSFFL